MWTILTFIFLCIFIFSTSYVYKNQYIDVILFFVIIFSLLFSAIGIIFNIKKSLYSQKK